MTFKRLYHTFRISMIRGGTKRAEYIRKKHLFSAIGENCSIQRRKLPLYANLIKLGCNVHLASGVSFITHDIAHTMLNHIDYVKQAGGVQEGIGCIEIGDNVFVGSGVRILYDTKIGSNVIIGAGSIITKDIPSDSVVVGSPGRVIFSFDDYVEKVIRMDKLPPDILPRHQTVGPELAKLLWDRFDNNHLVNH